ncbi:hypothetical protein FB451DRAFT_1415160 [Mycena latifolia]|nr:hypothetical protein FB451DRAFT_1415160 [Mycena latifolia]
MHFIATALLASAAPALSATITAFAGAGCTGAITSLNSSAVGCITFTNGGLPKSIGYSGANQISFFDHDACSNGAFLTIDSGSGCVTAPAGYASLVTLDLLLIDEVAN